MRILIVSHEYPPIGGGGANACFFLSREYVKNGHEVTILTSSFHNLPRIEIVDGVEIIRVRAFRKQETKSTLVEMFSYLVSAFIKANQLASKRDYDICHVFFGIPSGPIGFWLKKRYTIPYVVRLGGGDIPGAQKRYAFVYKVIGMPLRKIWKEADAVVANSEGLLQRARKFSELGKFKIISNGIDIAFFNRDSYDYRKRDEIRILFVSRLIEGKRIQYIIPMMQTINDKLPEKRVYLDIVGDGPYRSALENVVRKCNTQEFVKFYGQKNKTELLEFYSQADLFILPSISEGMPNVVLEAMAMSLPVIMTPCEGSKELVTDNGIITSIESFQDALLELLCDEKKRKSMGINSRSNILKYFTWDVAAEKYMTLFAEIIQAARG